MNLWPYWHSLTASFINRQYPRPDTRPDHEGPPWDDFDGGLTDIPVGVAGCVTTYGDLRHTIDSEGFVHVLHAWESANMMSAAGFPGYSKRVYLHRKTEPYLREAMRRAAIVAPDYVIDRLGCFNPRHQRYDQKLPLSVHSWGAAVDINPDDNAGKYIKNVPEPWSDGWNHIWPKGLPRTFVEAFESVGWVWGGRWKSYLDPMHFQLLKIR